MVAGGCLWLLGDVSGCWGACMVARVCVWLPGGAWLPGGMGGCQGACKVTRGACVGYDEIRSMSGWYASYWNAFLFQRLFSLMIKASKHPMNRLKAFSHCIETVNRNGNR